MTAETDGRAGGGPVTAEQQVGEDELRERTTPSEPQADGAPETPTDPPAQPQTASAATGARAVTGAGAGESSGRTRMLRNRTPDRLIIRNAAGSVLTIGPLAQWEPVGSLDAWPLEDLERRGLVGYESPPPEPSFSWLGGLLFAFFMLAAVANGFVSEQAPDYTWLVWVGLGSLYALIAVGAVLFALKGGATVARQVAQALVLILVVTISVGAPVWTVSRFSNLDLRTDVSLEALGRILQITFISLACMIPGLLFFLFDRQRLSTLRDRFEQQIFRLDPNVETLSDVYARYGKQIEENFGQIGGRADTRLGRQRRWPIVVSTVALAFGWILTLVPAGPSVPVADPTDIPALLLPQQNAVAFGFLGAYFFALNLVLRRYARGDLRPKAYSTITVRILVVVVLGWVLQLAVPQQPVTLVVAFLVGIVPETVITFFREVYRTQLVRRLTGSLDERLPLQELEGVDVYDRSRLLDEGVANIEALAHHDFVDLLLETRIPAGRLVDWVDQAILYLHLGDPASTSGGRESAAARARLHALGIRTATDLEASRDVAARQGRLQFLQEVLTGAPAASSGDSLRLDILLTGMADDEWMSYVRNWRRSSMLSERTIELDESGAVRSEERREICAPAPAGAA